MKTKMKIFVAIVALLTVVCYSCSSEDSNSCMALESDATTSLKMSLDSLNKSILAELGKDATRSQCNCTGHNCGPNCQCGCQAGGGHEQTDTTTVVVLKDFAGAVLGGGAGAQAGAALGSFLPLIGNAAGGLFGTIIGAVIGGAAASLADYYEITPTIAELRDTLSSIHYDNVIGTMNKVLYINGVPDYTYSPAFLNNMSDSVVDLFEISSLHNYMLDELRDTLTSKRQFKYISDLPNTWVDSLSTHYNNGMLDEANVHYGGTLYAGPQSNLEIVLYSFADLFQENATSEKEVNTIIANYINYMNTPSTALSKEEKKIITIALGVCWHSYQYWTQQ